MKYKFIPMLISLVFSLQANGQIAAQVIKNLKELKNITYGSRSSGANLFTGERSIDSNLNLLSKQPNGDWAFKVSDKLQEKLYYGNKIVYLDLLAKTYRIANDSLKSSSIYLPTLVYIINELEEDLKKGKPVVQLPDSVIAGKAYYHLRITQLDSLKRGKKVYNATTFVIDKKSYLPYYYRKDGLGFVDGTDIYVTQLDEYSFFGYKVNSKDFPDLSKVLMPADFTIRKSKDKQTLLEKGTKAPEIELLNMDGKLTKLTDYRGKILLISFTDNGCGYCAMSIAPINHLAAKYKNADFEVININAFDSRAAILDYNESYKVKYKSYKPGKSTLKDYHVESYPNFYIIDKSGNIVNGYIGFSSGLEKDLSEVIDRLTLDK